MIIEILRYSKHMHSKNRGSHALYESTQKSMNSAYRLMTMDRDLVDRPLYNI